MSGHVCAHARAHGCTCVFVCVCLDEGGKKNKNTSGDETDTFPDGPANITLPDTAHTHTSVFHQIVSEKEEVGL